MQKLITLDEAVKEAAEVLVNENLRILNECAFKLGSDKALSVAMVGLQGFVASLLYKVLKQNRGPMYSKEEVQEQVLEDFAKVKFELQNAISAGFQSAMSSWSGTHVEYYCQVRTVPEPINKKLC